MNNTVSGKYTNSMLQDIMKKYAPVNESNERKVDECILGWIHTLSYQARILSRAKDARQAQLILGEALTKKFSDPLVISGQSLGDVSSSSDRADIFLLLVGADAASKVVEMSDEREAVLRVAAHDDLEGFHKAALSLLTAR